MKKLIALLTLVLASFAAKAEFYDGNKLLAKMNSSETLDQMLALGYVMGAADATNTLAHCPPGNVTAGQMVDIVKRALTVYPEQRHKTGDWFVIQALKLAFPCPERPKASPQTDRSL
jgi:hypothetical protein